MRFAPQLGYSAQQCDLELYDAYTADEIFLTSTAGGLIPVVELDGRRIGCGEPGPIYRKLAETYRDALNASS